MTTQPTIVRVDITRDEGDKWTPPGWNVKPVWSGVDRPDSMSWLIANKRTAERLRKAVLAGAVFYDISVGTDVNGKTYVNASTKIRARAASADLGRLGF